MSEGKIHAAKTLTPPLARIISFLGERGIFGATTLEIIDHTKVAAISARVTELRRQGYEISCKREGKPPQVRYRYHLIGKVESGKGAE